MDVHDEHFSDFLLHYEYVTLQSLQSEIPEEVHQSPRVVLAHIVEIVSANAFGLDLVVEDHTGIALLALRGYTAFDFYEEHLRPPQYPDPITDPYALDGNWFRTYLFMIDLAAPFTIDGNNAYIVPKICMRSRIVYQFFHYQMSENDCACYRRAKAVAVPRGDCSERDGICVSPGDSMVSEIVTRNKKCICTIFVVGLHSRNPWRMIRGSWEAR